MTGLKRGAVTECTRLIGDVGTRTRLYGKLARWWPYRTVPARFFSPSCSITFSRSGYPAPKLRVSQFPPRSAIFSPPAITSNWPVLPGVQTTSMFRRCLIRVTRLATLALLFCHVGQ